MGSWAELDAYYPPGALTPAAALIVALCHLEGATSIYGEGGRLADWLPRRGLAYDQDLLARAEGYIRDVAVDSFLEQAHALLNPEQRRCLLLNLLDAVLAAGVRPEDHAVFMRVMAALGTTVDEMRPYIPALALKNELSLFPQ
jgi:hypothetical protein